MSDVSTEDATRNSSGGVRMATIEVGSMVTVESGRNVEDYSHLWNLAMTEFVGCVCEVVRVHPEVDNMIGGKWAPCCTLKHFGRIIPYLFDIRYLTPVTFCDELNDFFDDY